ncbi:alpha/beta hydrolase, putative [Plasmodium gallinaceum]|uniref:Alpha/beta hydrolase, putative n=1 Tax=Plasmodium gallinaceum TaxID=5849 RepID=A0A1J1GLG4_PLAGA|nr:alpha/beta hydrolase, putative [Plasmodium gallinaceum]CRG93256.1 alpha/beta hydrolase, putative [Plasmodium gallinaceum]
MGNSLSNTALFRPTEPSYNDDLKNLVFIPELLGIDVGKFWSDEVYEIFNKEENMKALNNKKFPALFLYFSKELKTKHTIMYFHSNSCDLGHIYEELLNLHEHLHANILAIEYVGFGLCYLEGSPNQYNINRRALAAYNFLISLNMKSENILLFGRSIGTGVATKLAYNLKLLGKNVGGIILHAPYISIGKLVEDYFSYSSYFIENIYDNFKNLQLISNNSESDIPLLLIHGKEDEIIGVEHSEFLMKNLNNKYKNASYPNDSYHNYYYVIDDLGIPIKTFLETSSKSQHQKRTDIIIPKSFLKKDSTKNKINHLNEYTTEKKLEKKIKISNGILLAQHIKKEEKNSITIIKDYKSNSGSSEKRYYMDENSKKSITKNNEEKSINKLKKKNMDSDKKKNNYIKKDEKFTNDKKVNIIIYKENKTKDRKKNLDISLSGSQKEKKNQQKDLDQKNSKNEIRKIIKNSELSPKNVKSSENDKNLATNMKEKKCDFSSIIISKSTTHRKDRVKSIDSISRSKKKSEKKKADIIIDYLKPSSKQLNKNDHIENKCEIEKYERREKKIVKKDIELKEEEIENSNKISINEQYVNEMYVKVEHSEEKYVKEKTIKKICEKEGNIEEIYKKVFQEMCEEENSKKEFEKVEEDKEKYKNEVNINYKYEIESKDNEYEKNENSDENYEKERKEYDYEKDENGEFNYKKEGNEEYDYEKDGNEEYHYKKDGSEEYEYEKKGSEEYEYEKEGNKENEKIRKMEKNNMKKLNKDENISEEKREDNEVQEDEKEENFNIENYKVKDYKYYLKNNIINKEKIGCFMNKVINNLTVKK